MKKLIILLILCITASVYPQKPMTASDSVKMLLQENKQLKRDRYEAVTRLNQIKYYIRITEKRPANKVFFYGWVRRAVK